MSLSDLLTSHMQSLQHAQIFPCLRSASPRSSHRDTAEKHDASPPALTGKKGELPDARAVELRNREFQERALARPGFAEAVSVLSEPSHATPRMGIAAAPKRAPSRLLLPDVPIAALARALATGDDERRKKSLVWAYHLDPDRDRDAVALLAEAFAHTRTRWELTSQVELTDEKLGSVLASIDEAAPQALEALDKARARGPVTDLAELLGSHRGEAPLVRAHDLAEVFGIARNDVHLDRQIFLALADAIEARAPGCGYTGNGLRHAADFALEHDPPLRQRVDHEIERCKRLRDIASRKEAADQRHGPIERSPAVVLDPAIAPPIPEELLPEEALVSLPSATRKTTQRNIKPGVLVMPENEPAWATDAPASSGSPRSEASPKSGKPVVEVVGAVGVHPLLRQDGQGDRSTSKTPRGGFGAVPLASLAQLGTAARNGGASKAVAPPVEEATQSTGAPDFSAVGGSESVLRFATKPAERERGRETEAARTSEASPLVPVALPNETGFIERPVMAQRSEEASHASSDESTTPAPSAWAAIAPAAAFVPPPIGGPRIGALPESPGSPSRVADPEKPVVPERDEPKNNPWILPAVVLACVFLLVAAGLIVMMATEVGHPSKSDSSGAVSASPSLPGPVAHDPPTTTADSPSLPLSTPSLSASAAIATSSARTTSTGPEKTEASSRKDPSLVAPPPSSAPNAQSAVPPAATSAKPTFNPKWEQW